MGQTYALREVSDIYICGVQCGLMVPEGGKVTWMCLGGDKGFFIAVFESFLFCLYRLLEVKRPIFLGLRKNIRQICVTINY